MLGYIFVPFDVLYASAYSVAQPGI